MTVPAKATEVITGRIENFLSKRKLNLANLNFTKWRGGNEDPVLSFKIRTNIWKIMILKTSLRELTWMKIAIVRKVIRLIKKLMLTKGMLSTMMTMKKRKS